MGQRYAVEKLNEEELDFVLECYANNDNDRQVSLKFAKRFNGKKLNPSSLNRWYKMVGEERIHYYRMARWQAKALRETIPESERKEDYQIVLQNIDEHLLTATRKVISENPAKLLLVRQREENFRLKREQIALKEKELAFEREKFERTQNASADRFKIASDTWKYILSYCLKNEPVLADGLTKHSETLLQGLGEHIENIQTA